MRIAIIGYGKMGQAIAKMAQEQGHAIAKIIDHENANEINKLDAETIDVAIEFTGPKSAYNNCRSLMQLGIPTVSGSTGWSQHMAEIKEMAIAKHTAFIWASNYSIGVNLFFSINRKVAELMARYPQYIASITETHHTQKLDAPSGTAISLAEQIINATPNLEDWHLKPTDETENSLPITALRQDAVPGTHQIAYQSGVDEIMLRHTAHSREGFVAGALAAAQYIYQRKGVFSMEQVLGI